MKNLTKLRLWVKYGINIPSRCLLCRPDNFVQIKSDVNYIRSVYLDQRERERERERRLRPAKNRIDIIRDRKLQLTDGYIRCRLAGRIFVSISIWPTNSFIFNMEIFNERFHIWRSMEIFVVLSWHYYIIEQKLYTPCEYSKQYPS